MNQTVYPQNRSSQTSRVAETIGPLLAWYAIHQRSLPWRKEPTPYHIWLSEIIFQQTRIEAGTAYYLRFLEEAPTVEALAALPEERLLKLWQGLGYYNRARNLQKAAKIIEEQYGGKIPDDPETLETLPGIGTYTAGAICSIAYGRPVPAVDGNVLRVYARVLGDRRDVALPETKKQLQQLLTGVWQEAAPEKPGDLNQAIMDLGATVCIPNGEPHCEACPLQPLCEACRTGKIAELPVKGKPKGRRIEERTILLLRLQPEGPGEAKYYVRRRPKTGLLADLWELPGELGHLTENAARKAILGYLPGCKEMQLTPFPAAKHVFSHVEWHMTGYLADVMLDRADACCDAGGGVWATAEELESDYALPSAFKPYLPR